MKPDGRYLALAQVVIIFGCFVEAQRVAPGVNPQAYQQQQQHQYQQQPQYQQGHVAQHPQQHPPQVAQQHYQQPQQVPHQQQQPPQQQQQVYQQQQQQVPQQPQHQQVHQQQPPNPGHGPQHGQILNAQNMEHEKEHLGEHLHAQIDTSKMTEQELQFHYFKMHDSDNNNKLDGCELIKSLIHWHAQGKDAHGQGIEEKIFADEELQSLIDPILTTDDASRDGFIDYPEFIRAQQKASAQKQQQQQDDDR